MPAAPMSDLAEHTGTLVLLLSATCAIIVAMIGTMFSVGLRMLTKRFDFVDKRLDEQHNDAVIWRSNHMLEHAKIDDHTRLQDSKISALGGRLAFIEGRFVAARRDDDDETSGPSHRCAVEK